MKRGLFIGHVWPEPNTTAAGNRMLQLLEAFLIKGYQITFVCASAKTSYSHDLGKMGITEKEIFLNDSSFDDFVQELMPHVVVFDRFMVEEQFGWRVMESCPEAVRILNTEDLHSLRQHREKCIKENLGFRISEYLEQDKTKREIASIYRSDFTLLVSSFEKELLEKHVHIDGKLLMHLPFMLETITDSTLKEWPKFEERSDFIAFGNGRHAPNVDSYRYLKKAIWPLIRKQLPMAQLHIYGAYLPQQIEEMHDPKEGFLVHGWVENLKEKIHKAKVVLAPLRFGAGIKGKLITAMQNGAPSVTTHLGVEGMGTMDWPGCIADNPKTFAKQAIHLYQDSAFWLEAQKKGGLFINSLYEKDALGKAFFKHLETLQSTLKEHRENNFVGSLLQHQTMAATKYMGKWIEEKNRPTKQ